MRILKINAKCSDLCFTNYIVDGVEKGEIDGYPLEISGLCGGDYIDIELDLETGKILGWQSPSHKYLMFEMGKDDEESDEEEEFEASITKDQKSEISSFLKGWDTDLGGESIQPQKSSGIFPSENDFYVK